MASTITFDTLHFAKRLQKVGFSPEQAEVQAELLAEAFDEKIATKQDIKHLRADMQLKMAELKNELIKWVLGVSVAQAAIIISCIKLIH